MRLAQDVEMLKEAPLELWGTRRVRWLPGIVLLVLAPFCIVATWIVAGKVADGDRTVQMVAGIVALSIAFLIQVVWWMFFARLSWRARLIGIACVALLGLTATQVLRFEGHSGEMLPTGVAFVWSPTPEDHALEYFRNAGPQPATEPDSSSVAATDGDWPQYRGSHRDGIMPDAQIRTDWAANPPQIVWKHPVGLGWSSFAVVGDRIYTQEQRGENEVVVCYAAATGDQLWVHADKTRFSEALGGDGPRGTPTFAEGAIYALGATGILNCLDPVTGTAIWRRDILEDAGNGTRVANIDWGMAGSPLVWNGKVYVVPGGGQGRGIIAYDATTGEPVWATGSDPASYAAPRIETIGGVPQLLVFHGMGLSALDPDSGDSLWNFGPWTNQPKVNAAQPIVQDDRVFISSGYTIGSVLLEPKRSDGGSWQVETVWRNDNEFKLKFNDAVLHDGYLYGLDEGILACYEFDTGKRQWKKGRYGYGQVILLGETLVILTEKGELAAVSATPERFEELALIPVLEDKTWNHPAYANGLLYVRNDREAACLDLRP